MVCMVETHIINPTQREANTFDILKRVHFYQEIKHTFAIAVTDAKEVFVCGTDHKLVQL